MPLQNLAVLGVPDDPGIRQKNVKGEIKSKSDTILPRVFIVGFFPKIDFERIIN